MVDLGCLLGEVHLSLPRFALFGVQEHAAALRFPNFDPVALRIGPLHLRWYALAYIAGLTLGWRYMIALVRKDGLWRAAQVRPGPAQLDDFLFWATIGVIVGGRLGYVLFYQPQLVFSDPLEIFKIWRGGMAFHGGLIGVATAILVFARANAFPFLTLADLVACAAPIGLFFGRCANFINGELWGRPSDAPWAMIFPDPHAGGVPRHPSQLYEAALEGLALFVILRFASHKFAVLKRPGLAAGIFLLSYGLSRFSLEFVREPDYFMPNFPLFLTMGMMLSTPMVLLGAYLIWRAAKQAPEAAAA